MRTGVMVTRGAFKFWRTCVRDRGKATRNVGFIDDELAALARSHPSLFRDANVSAEWLTLDDHDQPVGEPEPVDLAGLIPRPKAEPKSHTE